MNGNGFSRERFVVGNSIVQVQRSKIKLWKSEDRRGGIQTGRGIARIEGATVWRDLNFFQRENSDQTIQAFNSAGGIGFSKSKCI
jgi:hypothetical protein